MRLPRLYYLMSCLFFNIVFFISNTGSAQLLNRAISPIFNPDRTVTLRLKAPEADSVSVKVEFIENPQYMEKDEQGIWSITLGPAEPKIYQYRPGR